MYAEEAAAAAWRWQTVETSYLVISKSSQVMNHSSSRLFPKRTEPHRRCMSEAAKSARLLDCLP